MIMLNYLEVLPGAASNWYLVGGLACILGGIVDGDPVPLTVVPSVGTSLGFVTPL